MKYHLLVFGPGYTAKPLMQIAKEDGWLVTATYRSPEAKKMLEAEGYEAIDIDAGTLNGTGSVSHILTSIAPPDGGDPILEKWGNWLSAQETLQSLHYLSSTNVYGDHGGAWVDETTPPNPSLARGIRRLEAENLWQSLGKELQCPCFVYRLAGIYGPGRNALVSLKIGKARRIIKKNQIFGRIHRDDITQTIWAAMNSNHSGGVFNLADDKPTPPQEVISAAAALLQTAPPPEEAFEDADMSPMARSFYAENKRVKNAKIKAELGIELLYPSYKEGLKALFDELGGEEQ